MAQFAFNSAVSEGTGVSPFFVNLGYEPYAYSTPGHIATPSDLANETAQTLRNLHKDLTEDVAFYAQRSAIYYDRKRLMGPSLFSGDMVYLLRKNVKTKRPSGKLDHKKLGPFKIKKKTGPINYELSLPHTMKIYPVFYVSLLEKAPLNAIENRTNDVEPMEE